MGEDLTAGLPPEAELLLCCARPGLEAAERERMGRLLWANPDWDALTRLAARHGLLPLLYWHANAVAPQALPKPVLAHWWSHYEATARRNRAMTRELLRLLELLESRGIPAMPYKGPAPAAALYPDPALRQYEDLDILVRRRDMPQAQALLLAEGYRPAWPLGRAQEAAVLRAKGQYDVKLIEARSGIVVELHWKVGSDRFGLSMPDEGWPAERRRMTLAGASVRCFAPEELLLILCVHGARHAWARLAWIADVAALMRGGPALEWGRLVSLAEGLGRARMLALGLCLAHGLLDAPLPEPVWRRAAAAPHVQRLAAEISRGLFGLEAPRPSLWEHIAFRGKLLEHWPQRIGYGLGILLAPTLIEWSQWPLPRGLAWAYPPLRLMRLIKKHGWKVGRLAG